MKLMKNLKSLSGEDQIKTAIFAAELVLPVYENYFPDDLRVRNAIRAADVADAIRAAYAAYADAAYADAAAYAADAADAAAAAYAAYAAAYADDAAYAADAVRQQHQGGREKTNGLRVHGAVIGLLISTLRDGWAE